VAQSCIDNQVPVGLVLKLCQISRSSFYYKSANKDKKAGRNLSQITFLRTGGFVADTIVIDEIKELFTQEFVDYGYYKTTIFLKNSRNFVINHKKVYRLMKENDLLFANNRASSTFKRQWVTQLVPDPKTEFSYFEFDIKYIYIQGKRKNAQVLTILDVFSRWNMGQTIKWQMDYKDVITLFDTIFAQFKLPNKFFVRNDNGSQFIADLVQKYFKDKNVTQEFTKPATPEQNAHIESYHSIMERTICKKYQFDDIEEARNTLERFKKFYNFERIHSGTDYKSPYQFLLDRGTDMKNILTNYSNLKLGDFVL
jgi:transposase InsO family protein